jgi:hypothetical protein
VVSGLEEIDRLIGDAVDQPVFLSDTPRPTASEHKFQRFGLSRAFEGVPHHCLNEIEHSDGDAALVLYPKREVLKKLGLKCGDPLRLSLHQASLSAKRLFFQACAFLPGRGEAPRANGARFEGTGASERSP